MSKLIALLPLVIAACTVYVSNPTLDLRGNNLTANITTPITQEQESTSSSAVLGKAILITPEPTPTPYPYTDQVIYPRYKMWEVGGCIFPVKAPSLFGYNYSDMKLLVMTDPELKFKEQSVIATASTYLIANNDSLNLEEGEVEARFICASESFEVDIRLDTYRRIRIIEG